MILHPPALRTDLLRVQVHALRCMLGDRALTPGPWDVGAGSWVVAPPRPISESRFLLDEGSREYYGGELVCESVGRADAMFIATARNLFPQIVDVLEATLEANERMRDHIRFLRAMTSLDAPLPIAGGHTE
jgi:hypothetical protein